MSSRSVRAVAARAAVTLDHPVYHVRTWRGGFVAAAERGAATVLGTGLEIVDRVELGDDLADVALADDGAGWAWIAGGELRVGRPGSARASSTVTGEGACRWRSPGGDLWFATSSGPTVTVEVWTGSTVRRAAVPDAYRNSSVLLFDHPASDSMVLWLAAGTDGQQSWLLTHDGVAVQPEHLPCDDRGPALFGPTGDSFLAAGADDLVRVSWPGAAVLGRTRWPLAGDAAGLDVQLLPGGYASWNSASGRVLVVDLTTMAVVAELGFPVTDFGFAVAGTDGALLSVHQRDTIVLSQARDWSPDPDRQATGSMA